MLTVRSTRPDGTLLKSAPVHITVGPVANQSPHIAITRPAAGSQFPPDTAVEIIAEGIDPDGLIRKVEFFADGRKIGEQNIVSSQPPEPVTTQTFDFVWRFPTPGPHVLTARATDDDAATAGSAPIEIRVTIPDLSPIVRVVARDAFAEIDVERHSFPSLAATLKGMRHLFEKDLANQRRDLVRVHRGAFVRPNRSYPALRYYVTAQVRSSSAQETLMR